MNRLKKDNVEYYLLKNFKFLLTKNYEDIRFNKARYNRKLGRYADFHQILDLILEIDEELADAYALKEEYVSFNHYATQNDCRERLSKIIEEYAASNLSEFITLSGTLISWFDEIAASFASINSRRLSNGPVEGVDSKIKKRISNACGYQIFSRLRNRLMYSLNKSSKPSSYAINEKIKKKTEKEDHTKNRIYMSKKRQSKF